VSIPIKVGRGTLNVPWNILDRAIQTVAPVWAAQRLQARVGHTLLAGMGGYKGASRSTRTLADWNPMGGDADAQILGDLSMLRERSRDLERNEPIAGGAINTAVSNVVGTGLSMQSRVDADALGLSADEADAWQSDTMRKYELWACSVWADITLKQPLYQQQGLAFRSVCAAGDHVVLLTRNTASPLPVKLSLQHIEADRLCNKDRAPDRDGLVAGVQMDERGAPRQYHFASANPDRRAGVAALKQLTWTIVDAWGKASGRRNVLHLFERTRAGQTRGVPMLAPVIEPLKQLGRYTDAELTAAIGAAPHERIETRSNQRNGSRSRLLSTPAGDVELRIPKVRVGSFFPSLLEPRRRVEDPVHRREPVEEPGVIDVGLQRCAEQRCDLVVGATPRCLELGA